MKLNPSTLTTHLEGRGWYAERGKVRVVEQCCILVGVGSNVVCLRLKHQQYYISCYLKEKALRVINNLN